MGGSNSILNQEQLDEYVQLTYLTKTEILHIFNKFSKLGIEEMTQEFHYRFHVDYVLDIFPEIKYNPFRDRLIDVFSSYKDEHFSFEDVLDLCSVMSDNCPLKVKADWAFKVFDFDGDNQISKEDIFDILDRLTRPNLIDENGKNKIADIILNDMDIITSGGMSHTEFVHSMSKMPEFVNAFYFKV